MDDLKNELIVVTSMIAAQVLHQTLDDLEHTPYYKHKLKQVTKSFQNEITKECDSVIKRMYDADEKSVNNLQDEIYFISTSLTKVRPKDMILIRAFIENLINEKNE